jgi:hypothetical protein
MSPSSSPSSNDLDPAGLSTPLLHRPGLALPLSVPAPPHWRRVASCLTTSFDRLTSRVPLWVSQDPKQGYDRDEKIESRKPSKQVQTLVLLQYLSAECMAITSKGLNQDRSLCDSCSRDHLRIGNVRS